MGIESGTVGVVNRLYAVRAGDVAVHTHQGVAAAVVGYSQAPVKPIQHLSDLYAGGVLNTHVDVHRFSMSSPSDVSGLRCLLDDGVLRPEDIVAVLAKTEGNGCVNDYARGFASLSFALLLAERLGVSPAEVERRVALVMSGGTEGVMSPHATVFAARQSSMPLSGQRRLAIGVGFTRDFLPEEVGRLAMVRDTARATREAMQAAGITDTRDVHFVQIKCPLLTAERIDEAGARGRGVVTQDTYESMGYSRGASALGVAVALGEVAEHQISDAVIVHDWSLYSSVASTSAGVEVLNNEIIVMGNSLNSTSDLVIAHDVMADAIDGHAVRRALRRAGIELDDGTVAVQDAGRLVNVLAKAEPDPYGKVRDRRNTMLNDSDINRTRHARAAVNAVIASIVGDPMIYVSGGAEHQGPAGGGPVAVIARAR